MFQSGQSQWSWWCFVLVVGLAGCGEERFRAETSLAADGTVERRVLVPKAYHVEPADKGKDQASVWARTALISGGRIEQHSGALTELFDPPKTEDKTVRTQTHWLSEGKFSTATSWPGEFEITGETGRKSQPVREFQREDLGFVVVQHWRETITDVVTLSDHRLARDELAAWGRDYAVDVLREIFGSELETAEIEVWLRDVITKVWLETCDEIYAVCAQEQNLARREKLLLTRVAAVMKKYAIPVLNEQGEFLQNREVEAAVRSYLQQTVVPLLKRKDGQPVDLIPVQKFLELLAQQDAQAVRQELEQHPYTLAAQLVWKKRFDNDDAAGKFFTRCMERMFGVHHGVLQPQRTFRYQLDYSGLVLQSNGVHSEDSQLVWEFPAPAIFPLGYTMHAVIAAPQRELIDKLAGTDHLTKPAEIRRYVTLTRDSDALQEMLRTVCQTGDWSHWQKYREKLAADSENEFEFKQAREIGQLLGR